MIRPALAALVAAGLLAATPVVAAPAEEVATRSLYLLLIRQARTDGRPRAALAYLADFDRQHPADAEARILRINCLLDLGQVDDAQAAAARLPAGGGTDAVHGHVLAARGEWGKAAAKYRTALAASPADPLTGNALGYAELRAGNAAHAVEALRAAADLAPADPVIRNNLLLALTMSGRTEEIEAGLRAVPDTAARATLRRQLAAEAARIAPPEEGR